MRKIILLPLKYILFFVISYAVFLLFTLIFNWGRWFSPYSGVETGLFMYLGAAAGSIIVPAVSSALIFAVFDYRNVRLHFISVILLSAAVFMTLLFGFRFTGAMTVPVGGVNYQPFEAEIMHPAENYVIYTDKVGAGAYNDIKGVVIRNRDSGLPGFRLYEDGRVESTPSPALILDRDRAIDIIPANPVFNSVFAPPGLLGDYFRDISFFNNAISKPAGAGGVSRLLYTAIFAAFLIVCLLFKGATVWPFFDIILILFLHRLVFYLFRVFSSESVFISETFFGGNFTESIPMFSLLALSAVILFAGILLKIMRPQRNKKS